jgi:hypothetical protein
MARFVIWAFCPAFSLEMDRSCRVHEPGTGGRVAPSGPAGLESK